MKNLETVLGYLILVLAFSLSFNILEIDSALIIIILLLSFIKAYKKVNTSEIKLFFKSFYPFLIFFLMLVIGLLYSDNLSKGFSVIERSLSFLVFPIIFYINKNNKQVNFLPEAFTLGVISTAVYCNLYQFVLYGSPFKYGFSKMLFPIEIDPTYFSMYILMALIVCLSYLLKSHKKLTLPISFVIIYLFYFILVLGSKSALVVLIIILMLFIAYFIKEKLSVKYFLLTPLVLGLLIVITYYNPLTYSRFYSPIINSDFDFYQFRLKFIGDRYYVWKCAIENLNIPNILYGYGTGDEVNTMSPCYDKYRLKVHLNPHSIYFSSLLKLGIIGFIPFVLSISYGLWKNKGQKMFILFSIIIIIMGLVESLFDRSKGIVFFCLFSSFFVMKTINTVYLKQLK
ncbi:O-antigen ligase family protein [Lacinutrix mariniflava]|uniref:O-antigen ligase family protein n=1 Tax=Lacinutrix mariniflava TaxID=342955 RepID=UPI0006E19D8C|nr:O-antigen ligase family protein [Lacinutrix mariniflava]